MQGKPFQETLSEIDGKPAKTELGFLRDNILNWPKKNKYKPLTMWRLSSWGQPFQPGVFDT